MAKIESLFRLGDKIKRNDNGIADNIINYYQTYDHQKWKIFLNSHSGFDLTDDQIEAFMKLSERLVKILSGQYSLDSIGYSALLARCVPAYTPEYVVQNPKASNQWDVLDSAMLMLKEAVAAAKNGDDPNDFKIDVLVEGARVQSQALLVFD